MKRLALALFLLLAFRGYAQTNDAALLELEAKRRDAIAAKDFATLETIYAADFRGIFGTGVAIDRAGLFNVFRGDRAEIAFHTDELTVRRFGETAIVTGRLTGRIKNETVTQQRFSHWYAWRNGRWEMFGAQGTPVREMKD